MPHGQSISATRHSKYFTCNYEKHGTSTSKYGHKHEETLINISMTKSEHKEGHVYKYIIGHKHEETKVDEYLNDTG